MPENDVSESTYVSEIKQMLTVQDITNYATKVRNNIADFEIFCSVYFSFSPDK